jgi:hypothetical protein
LFFGFSDVLRLMGRHRGLLLGLIP